MPGREWRDQRRARSRRTLEAEAHRKYQFVAPGSTGPTAPPVAGRLRPRPVSTQSFHANSGMCSQHRALELKHGTWYRKQRFVQRQGISISYTQRVQDNRFRHDPVAFSTSACISPEDTVPEVAYCLSAPTSTVLPILAVSVTLPRLANRGMLSESVNAPGLSLRPLSRNPPTPTSESWSGSRVEEHQMVAKRTPRMTTYTLTM